MRVMVMIKATKNSEAGQMPSQELLAEMGRFNDPMPGEDAEIEIRPVFEAEDFGAELTPELQVQEEKLRAEVERQRAR